MIYMFTPTPRQPKPTECMRMQSVCRLGMQSASPSASPAAHAVDSGCVGVCVCLRAQLRVNAREVLRRVGVARPLGRQALGAPRVPALDLAEQPVFPAVLVVPHILL